MVKHVWIRIDEVLLGFIERRCIGMLDVYLVLIVVRQGRKRVPEGANVVLNVVHIMKVKVLGLLPQLGVGLDAPGNTRRLIRRNLDVLLATSKINGHLALAKKEVGDAGPCA
jgi:hypothetical protein